MLQTRFRPEEREAWLKAHEPPENPRPKRKIVRHKRGRRKKPRRKPSRIPKPLKLKADRYKCNHSRPFKDTPLGFFLYLYRPVMYHLFMEMARQQKKSFKNAVPYSIIEDMTVKGSDPIYATANFRRALLSYKKYGLSPLHKKNWRLKDVIYFAKNSYLVHKEMERCLE